MEISELISFQFRTDIPCLKYVAAERTFQIPSIYFLSYAHDRGVNVDHIMRLDLTSHISGDMMIFDRISGLMVPTFYSNTIIHNPKSYKEQTRATNSCWVISS